MELHLKIIGFVLIGLAVTHCIFPKRFNWKEELRGLSLINKELMYVHTFFIALFILLNGILCLFSTDDLLHTHLGKRIAFGLFIFWGFRLLFQFFGYSAELWKGKTFETAVHIIFTIFWIYITFIFGKISFG